MRQTTLAAGGPALCLRGRGLRWPYRCVGLTKKFRLHARSIWTLALHPPAATPRWQVQHRALAVRQGLKSTTRIRALAFGRDSRQQAHVPATPQKKIKNTTSEHGTRYPSPRVTRSEFPRTDCALVVSLDAQYVAETSESAHNGAHRGARARSQLGTRARRQQVGGRLAYA